MVELVMDRAGRDVDRIYTDGLGRGDLSWNPSRFLPKGLDSGLVDTALNVKMLRNVCLGLKDAAKVEFFVYGAQETGWLDAAVRMHVDGTSLRITCIIAGMNSVDVSGTNFEMSDGRVSTLCAGRPFITHRGIVHGMERPAETAAGARGRVRITLKDTDAAGEFLRGQHGKFGGVGRPRGRNLA